ncbi:nucleolar protein 12-like [Triplophysa dalaica]|uniref:nucleolar protein 12-like n=1 Tax=Triplophysa dalaica TaxID=1582913 RepID=UPI0024DFC966|nr:nucleolar protein 12-like [Triplophysa dalaica]
MVKKDLNKQRSGMKEKQKKCVVMFDDKERQEFLTGFHKRKVERRKAAMVEMRKKLKDEQKKVREGRHKEYLKMLMERQEALNEADEPDELEDAITSTTECLQYNHPNHTVTVTTISDLDLSGSRLLESQRVMTTENCDDAKDAKEEQVQSLPRNARKPMLSKKIQSLTASINIFTKRKRQKHKQDSRWQHRQSDKKSSAIHENKLRLGRTTKKQRRQRTGSKGRSQD